MIYLNLKYIFIYTYMTTNEMNFTNMNIKDFIDYLNHR